MASRVSLGSELRTVDSTHLPVPPAAYPGLQVMHSSRVGTEKVDSWHSTQSDSSSCNDGSRPKASGSIVPLGQSEHHVLPVSAVKRPAPQTVHEPMAPEMGE